MRNTSHAAASQPKSKADPIRSLFDAITTAMSSPRRSTTTGDSDPKAATARFPFGAVAKEGGNAAAAAATKKKTSKKKKKKEEGCKESAASDGDSRRWSANSCFGIGEAWSESANSCFGLAEAWSAMVRGFCQVLPGRFKSKGRRKEKAEHLKSARASVNPAKDSMSLEPFMCFVLGGSDWNLEVLLDAVRDDAVDAKCSCPPLWEDDSRLLGGVTDRKRSGQLDGFLSNVGFARVGGTVQGLTGTSAVGDEVHGANGGGGAEMAPSATSGSPKEIANAFLSTQLTNMEKLRSTLSTVSLKELVESLPQFPPSPPPPAASHPDKKKLFAVQDFFRYAEIEGRRLFDELDRDGDGRITLEDLEVAMNSRRLPKKYARQFLQNGRTNLFSRSIGWKQFLALMEQKEPTILRAYTSLCLSKSGTVEKSEILASLRSAGLPANEDNAAAMIRYLNSDAGGSISYRHFRNFMVLLPSERLEDDPRNVWFEAATAISVSPPLEMASESVKRSAMAAGGLACALLTSLMHHPLDTMKGQTKFSSTTLETTMITPCEVLKQQLPTDK